MPTSSTVNANDKLEALITAIAGLLDCRPDEIRVTASLSEIFTAKPQEIKNVWKIIHELAERRLRITGDWTPVGLAIEWRKTDVYHRLA